MVNSSGRLNRQSSAEGQVISPKPVFTIINVQVWEQLLNQWIDHMPQFEIVGSAPSGDAAITEMKRSAGVDPIVVIDACGQLALETARAIKESDISKQLVAVSVEEEPEQAVAWAATGALGLIGRSASLAELDVTLRQVAAGQAFCSAAISGALVRGVGDRGTDRSHRRSVPLTEREQEVARLVAGGLTNHEIAVRLQISTGTVKSHVHNIIRKLGIARRAHIGQKLTPEQRPPVPKRR